jgi:hypothetical protein
MFIYTFNFIFLDFYNNRKIWKLQEKTTITEREGILAYDKTRLYNKSVFKGQSHFPPLMKSAYYFDLYIKGNCS